MPYTAEKATRLRSSEELRRMIPGWGVDLDPANRPSVPRERDDVNGSHWDFPERQQELRPRERSIEHAMLPPVFGTSVPLKGLSGVIRRFAYSRFSEGRAAHWMLLIVGDRVDAIESHLVSFARLRPDNPITQTGVLSEFRRHPFKSRFGQKRADNKHVWMDPIIVAGPWVVVGLLAFAGVRMARRRIRR